MIILPMGVGQDTYLRMFNNETIKNYLTDLWFSDRVSLVNLTSIIYLAVLFFTIHDFYEYIPLWVLVVHGIAVCTIATNLILLTKFKNRNVSAAVLIFTIFAVHMANVNFAGGINTLHYSWILIIPILAGATLGGKGQVFFFFATCAGTIFYFFFPENMDKPPYAEDSGYILFTRILSLGVFSLIMLSYYYTLKQKVHDLEIAKAEAQESSRLKSQFLANMSHELRTPLNSIIGFSDAIRVNPHDTQGIPQLDEYAGYINSSGRHLLGLVNDILDMAKIESGKMEPRETELDIEYTVLSVIGSLEPQILSKVHSVSTVFEDGLCPLYADERLIRQMIINLVSNAIKFTDEGGSIIVESYNRANGGLTISVQDNGIGIEEEFLQRILEPFHQAEDVYARSEGGTGLGLSLVNAMIELHDGKLELESTKGVGTNAKLMFPIERVHISSQEQNSANSFI